MLELPDDALACLAAALPEARDIAALSLTCQRLSRVCRQVCSCSAGEKGASTRGAWLTSVLAASSGRGLGTLPPPLAGLPAPRGGGTWGRPGSPQRTLPAWVAPRAGGGGAQARRLARRPLGGQPRESAAQGAAGVYRIAGWDVPGVWELPVSERRRGRKCLHSGHLSCSDSSPCGAPPRFAAACSCFPWAASRSLPSPAGSQWAWP